MVHSEFVDHAFCTGGVDCRACVDGKGVEADQEGNEPPFDV